MTQAWGGVRRALADRNGATAIEYAMIAAGVATIVAVCYRLFFERMAAMLALIIF